ncbi:MAG: hypothetical protein HQK53_11635 [Oligoflexia bacterium]|nr:hypothetical protein [Oligoflexia bacterium]
MIPKVNYKLHHHESALAIKKQKDSPQKEHTKEQEKEREREENHGNNNTHGPRFPMEQVIAMLNKLNNHSYYQQKGVVFSCVQYTPSLSSSPSSVATADPHYLSELLFNVHKHEGNEIKLIQSLSGEQFYSLFNRINNCHTEPATGDLINVAC